MKNLAIFLVMSSTTLTYADCIHKYRSKHFKRYSKYVDAKARYQKKLERYYEKKKRNRRNLSNVTNNSSFGIKLAGAFVSKSDKKLEPPKEPKKTEFAVFLEGVLKVYDDDLNTKSEPPKLLRNIYDKAQNVDADVTYQKLKDLIRKGIDSGSFCGFFGVHRENKVTKYILDNLEKKNIIAANHPNTNNSDLNSKNEFGIDNSGNKDKSSSTDVDGGL